jgi:hypothetical protein
VTRGGAAECTPLGRRDVIHILTRVPFSENAVTNVRKDIIRFQGDITISDTCVYHAGVNFEHADLSCLDLRRCNFRYANLAHTNLRAANLSECDFMGANLRAAVLDVSIRASDTALTPDTHAAEGHTHPHQLQHGHARIGQFA